MTSEKPHTASVLDDDCGLLASILARFSSNFRGRRRGECGCKRGLGAVRDPMSASFQDSSDRFESERSQSRPGCSAAPTVTVTFKAVLQSRVYVTLSCTPGGRCDAWMGHSSRAQVRNLSISSEKYSGSGWSVLGSVCGRRKR